MKKLILLLLFIPLISFGQVTYKDVISISSTEMFKKVMIENEFEYMEGDGYSTEDILVYGQLVFRDDDGKITGSDNLAYYLKKGNRFNFQFLNSIFGKDEYSLIYDKVKEECKFYKIINFSESDYACYSCPDSSVGKIGFSKVDGVGMILNFRE